jgi:hypothetical protein
MQRVLRPGGRLLVQVPAYDWLRGRHDREVATRERYTAASLRRKLEAAGFEVERVGHANTLLLPLAIGWRLVERWLPAADAADLAVPSAPVNALLKRVLAVERRWLARHDLPLGLSVIALARRPLRDPSRADRHVTDRDPIRDGEDDG